MYRSAHQYEVKIMQCTGTNSNLEWLLTTSAHKLRMLKLSVWNVKVSVVDLKGGKRRYFEKNGGKVGPGPNKGGNEGKGGTLESLLFAKKWLKTVFVNKRCSCLRQVGSLKMSMTLSKKSFQNYQHCGSHESSKSGLQRRERRPTVLV